MLARDDAIRRYFADDAYIAGLVIRILVHANVFLCHPVDMVVRAFLGDLGDVAAHREPVEWIFGVDDIKTDLGLLLHVEGLTASLGCVDQDMGAVEIDPDRCYLWCAIGHDRCQVCEDGLLEEVESLLWNLLTHILCYFLPMSLFPIAWERFYEHGDLTL